MTATFDINQASRNVLLKFLEDYSLKQLNTVPHGFNNNLIWNIAHIIVVQQQLVYNLSGLPMMVSNEMISNYRSGTEPQQSVTQNEVDEIKWLLFSTLEKARKDFANNVFHNYDEFVTMSGFNITNAKAAMEFNNYHEAIHTGIMMQIKKFI